MAEVPTPEGTLLIPCEIRRSRRSRYIRLTLGSAGQARLSIPWHCSNAEALAFLRTQGQWLQTQLAKAPARQSLLRHLEAHPAVHALGHSLAVKIGHTRARSYYLYSLNPPEILFQLRSGSSGSAGGSAAGNAGSGGNGGAEPPSSGSDAELLAQLRAFAQEVIPLRVTELAALHGIRFTRVSIRDQASRWGSCSTTGTISLNWRLVLLRPLLQDHVILHELAHLREMNHSERFWNLLRSYDPYCDAHNAQLNVAATKVMPLGRVR